MHVVILVAISGEESESSGEVGFWSVKGGSVIYVYIVK